MRSSHHFARGIAVAAVGLATLVQTNDAEACYGCFDGHGWHVTPGLACQVDVGSKDAKWGYFGAGGICNYDDQEDVLVHCPLERNQISRDGLSCASATLIYKNENVNVKPDEPPGCGLVRNSSYECRVKAKDATGYWGWSWADNNGYLPPENVNGTLFNSSADVWTVDWRASMPQGDGHAVGLNDREHGSYWLSCWLPSTTDCRGRTCVSSLKWIERK